MSPGQNRAELTMEELSDELGVLGYHYDWNSKEVVASRLISKNRSWRRYEEEGTGRRWQENGSRWRYKTRREALLGEAYYSLQIAARKLAWAERDALEACFAELVTQWDKYKTILAEEQPCLPDKTPTCS